MPKVIEIDKSYPKDALERLYKTEPDGRVKERLLAIVHFYEDKSATEIAALLKRSENAVRTWRVLWNKACYQGIKPQFSGGPKSQMSESEWLLVLAHIKDKGMSIQDVQLYIKDAYKVEYSYNMVWYRLRAVYKVPYSKPYIQNGKMPGDVEVQIEKK